MCVVGVAISDPCALQLCFSSQIIILYTIELRLELGEIAKGVNLLPLEEQLANCNGS